MVNVLFICFIYIYTVHKKSDWGKMFVVFLPNFVLNKAKKVEVLRKRDRIIFFLYEKIYIKAQLWQFLIVLKFCFKFYLTNLLHLDIESHINFFYIAIKIRVVFLVS